MSYIDIRVHCVFATKQRRPLIEPEWRARLHEYLGGCATRLGCRSLGTGGVDDHVHMLLGLQGSHAISDVMREIKSASSRWIHDQIGRAAFAWQEGFSAFSVSASNVGAVRRYIERQEEHHRRQSSLDELRALLKKHGFEVDPRLLM